MMIMMHPSKQKDHRVDRVVSNLVRDNSELIQKALENAAAHCHSDRTLTWNQDASEEWKD